MDESPGAAPPAPKVERARPLWTYFLTPIAILIAGLLVGGAVLYADDDGDGNVLPASAEDATSTPAAADMSTAVPTASVMRIGEQLTAYAKQLDLDTTKFGACLGKADTASLMNLHLREGVDLGVTGTPTFFINNKMIVGNQPTAVFVEVINAELKASPSTVDGYSDQVKALAASGRFKIVDSPPDIRGAAVEGNPKAKVVIAEFSDFQCPFCKRWIDQTYATVKSKVGNEVAIAFLHFPLVQIHPNAANASAAAICAGEQGQFWQMHDLLFRDQAQWEDLQ